MVLAGPGGLTLALVVFLAEVVYGKSPRQILPGAIYIGIAGVAGILAIGESRRARLAPEAAAGFRPAWRAERAARVAFFLGWDLAALGVLNISAAGAGLHPASVLAALAAVAVFAVATDRLLVLADTTDQEGGRVPARFFGLARPRRFVFWAAVVYPSGALLVGAVALAGSARSPSGGLFLARVALGAALLYSAAALWLIAQRYGRRESGSAPKALQVAVAVALSLAGALGALGDVGLYAYLVSAGAFLCLVASGRRLLSGARPSVL